MKVSLEGRMRHIICGNSTVISSLIYFNSLLVILIILIFIEQIDYGTEIYQYLSLVCASFSYAQASSSPLCSLDLRIF